MGLLALVWVIEAFDIGIVGQVVLVLRKLWKLTPGDIGLLGISSTIGVVIGLYSAGPVVDKFGRKMVLIWGVVWFTVFTVTGSSPCVL
jgi:putative MFS transporter